MTIYIEDIKVKEKDVLKFDDESESTSIPYKCIHCQKKRLKCNMNAPNCDKCIKNNVKCYYSKYPPRARKPKADYIASHTSRFSLKNNQKLNSNSNPNNSSNNHLAKLNLVGSNIGMDTINMLHSSISPTNNKLSPNWNYDPHSSPQQMMNSSLEEVPMILKSNINVNINSGYAFNDRLTWLFMEGGISTYYYTDRELIIEIIECAHNTFFNYANFNAPIFKKDEFLNKKRSNYLTDSIICLGLRALNPTELIEHLIYHYQSKLSNYLELDDHIFDINILDSLQFHVLCFIISYQCTCDHGGKLSNMPNFSLIFNKVQQFYNQLQSTYNPSDDLSKFEFLAISSLVTLLQV